MSFKYYINKKNIDIPVKSDKKIPVQSDNPFAEGYKHIRKGYYPPEFYKIRKAVMKRFGERCFLCGELADEIHHIDYDKMNSDINNLMLLCKFHHGQTNHNRKYWEKFLKEKMKEKFSNNNSGGVDDI